MYQHLGPTGVRAEVKPLLERMAPTLRNTKNRSETWYSREITALNTGRGWEMCGIRCGSLRKTQLLGDSIMTWKDSNPSRLTVNMKKETRDQQDPPERKENKVEPIRIQNLHPHLVHGYIKHYKIFQITGKKNTQLPCKSIKSRH